jgi:hypothetical protein
MNVDPMSIELCVICLREHLAIDLILVYCSSSSVGSFLANDYGIDRRCLLFEMIIEQYRTKESIKSTDVHSLSDYS